ncbi:MAG: YdbH domain-containing protein [Myxococcales bacterium]|nr:YdbH domain-containing protein [Myxococcales bacterium]
MTDDSAEALPRRSILQSLAGVSAVLFAALAAIALAAYLARRPLAESLIAQLLVAQGVEWVAVSVQAFDASHIELRDIHLASGRQLRVGGLEVETDVEQISIQYSLGRLLQGRFDSVTLAGVKVRLSPPAIPEPETTREASASAPSTAADATDARADPATLRDAAWPLALPVREIRVDEFRAEIETADVRVAVEGDLSVQVAAGEPGKMGWQVDVGLTIADDDVDLPNFSLHRNLALAATARAGDDAVVVTLESFVFDASIGTGDGALRIGGTSPDLDARVTRERRPGGGLRVEIASHGGDVRVPALEVALAGIGGSTSFPVNSVPDRLSLVVDRVTDTAKPPRAVPFRVTGKIADGDDVVSFEARVADLRDRAALDLIGHFEPSSQSGAIRLHVPELSFAPDGLQPVDLAPILGDVVSKVSGRVEVLGDVRFDSLDVSTVTSSAEIALTDVSLETPLSKIQQIDTVVRLDGPWPPSTPPGQVLSVGSIDVGVAVTDGLAAFELRRNSMLVVERAELVFSGGKVRTAGEIDLSAPWQDLELEVKGVDLAVLLEHLDLEGLSGTGALNGRVPLRRTAEAIEIRDGRLETVGGGTLVYRPDPGVEDLANGQEDVQTVLDALSNFQYSALSLDVSGATSGQVRFLLHIAGNNPDFHDGFPVEFNLDLESPLMEILKPVTFSNSFVGAIEERVSEFRKRASNFRNPGASDAE